MKITPAQIARLQTCCSQMATRVAGYENSRASRLAWAAGILGRSVETFSCLTKLEAQKLIDAAQGEIGHRAPLKPSSRRHQTPPRTAEAARRAGVDGRHDGEEFATAPQLVSAEDMETITSFYQRLSLDRSQFDAWLQSCSSPLRGRKQIRTTADANAVRWALEKRLKAAGLWVDWTAA